MLDSVSFLNEREQALALWLIIGLIWALSRAEIRSSAAKLVTSFVHPKVSGPLVAGLVYAAGTVWLLWLARFWEGWMLKSTIYWFLGTALVLKFRTLGKGERFFLQIVRDVLAVAVILQFLVSLYTFPFYVELFLVPVLVLLGGSLAVAESDPRFDPGRRLVEGLVVAFSIAALALSLWHVLSDLDAFLSLDTGRAFLLAPILTVAFIPFLYAFAVVAAYELVFMRLDRALRNNGLADGREHRAVRWATIRACGLRLSSINKFSPMVMPRLFEADSTEDVLAAVQDFARQRHRLAG